MKKHLFILMLSFLPIMASAETVLIDGINYELNPTNHEATVVQSNYSGNIIIPEAISFENNNYTVKAIGMQAFMFCQNLKSIHIPNSVTYIGISAFYYCTSLENVILSEILERICQSAFAGCSALKTIKIPSSVRKIDEKAFNGCSNLKGVYIDDIESWCQIEFNNAYESNPLWYARHLYIGNEEITELVIPNTVTRINHIAFEGWTHLKTVYIPNSVTCIGEYNQEIKGKTNVEIIPVSA